MLNAIKSAKWKTNIFSISNKAAETRSKSNFDKPVEVIAGIIRTNLRYLNQSRVITLVSFSTTWWFSYSYFLYKIMQYFHNDIVYLFF